MCADPMKKIASCLLIYSLLLLVARLLWAAEPLPTNSHFKIVKSFPVSEASWAEKSGDLYLVAAARSVLVYRKTGPGEADYQEVNRLFPGLDGTIENCAIANGRLYVPASTQGLLAYRLADLELPGVQPEMKAASAKKFGLITVAGGRVYARYQLPDGGLGVFDANTLALVGEGLPGTPIFGLTATADNVVYASSTTNYNQMLVIDARNAANLQIARRVTNAAYATFYRWPATAAGTNLYLPEGNGGVGVYNITDPLNPVLRYRHAAIGAVGTGRNPPGSVRAFATDGTNGFLVSDRHVKSVQILAASMQTVATNHTSVLNGGGLLDPLSVFLRDRVIGVPTTMEGARFYTVTNPSQSNLLLNIDLPSRMEGLAKLGPMIYVTSDIDGVWQIDWEAVGVPRASRRVPLKGLSEDLVLRGQHVYVANGIGLATLDVSNPTNPREVHYWNFPYTSTPNINEGWVEGVEVSGDILYAALGPAGFGTFSLANPAQPALLKKMVAGTSTWGHDISVHAARKLLAFSGNTRIVLINVVDPANPSLLSDVAVPNGKSTMGNAFSPDGNHLVVVAGGQFSVYSISNAASPVLLRTFVGQGSEGALFYRNYLLVSGYGSGTAVYRIGANPADLTKLQTLPCYFYNSKYFVEGDRLFTNSEGVDEFLLVPRLSAALNGDQVSVEWEGVGQLQSASTVDGQWKIIPNAMNPYFSSKEPLAFFRVKVQYGSPPVLEKFKTLLNGLEELTPPSSATAPKN
jgi:hypothetical protein